MLLYRREGEKKWKRVPMHHLVNDRFRGEFTVESLGSYFYTISATIDRYESYRQAVEKRIGTGDPALKADIILCLEEIRKAARSFSGQLRRKLLHNVRVIERFVADDVNRAAEALVSEEMRSIMSGYFDERSAYRYPKELEVIVERRKALFSTWYELFPRSCSDQPGKHGAFRDVERWIPRLAEMGFDVLYLPPIHPIGKTNRKGKNNSPTATAEDVGSPWAIGSEEGGHMSVHPQLGTLEDFEHLVKTAHDHGMEIALDLAFQCSPDHPYVREHPRWFRWLPDGSIRYAENPPKKYEDVVPFDFESEEWEALWEELERIVLFWVEKGVRIFRVDNPHTKPFRFWEWLIRRVKSKYPDVIFLSEAFTRPKVMYHLAKLGFSQSYTYFTWRNTKWELIQYLTELTETEVREFFRPNFWPNTPDILPEYLQVGGRPAFIIRLVLAATLSSNYGIYGPPYELCITEAIPGKEEYLNSEKYEIKHWNLDVEWGLKDVIARVNRIRRENPALQDTFNLRFCEVGNDNILAYLKTTSDLSNVVLVVVSLDPVNPQSGVLRVPIWELGLNENEPYMAHDLLGGERYIWQGSHIHIDLNPHISPAKIFRLHLKRRREQDFEYFL